MPAKLNERAWHLRSELFALVNKFKALQLEAGNSDVLEIDQQVEASSQLDAVACRLAAVYEELPELFTDAARDTKDQSYGVRIAASPATCCHCLRENPTVPTGTPHACVHCGKTFYAAE